MKQAISSGRRLVAFWVESSFLYIVLVLACQEYLFKIPVRNAEWIVMGVIFYSSCFAAWEKQRRRAEAAEAANAPPEKSVFLKEPQAVLDLYGQTGYDAESRLLPYLDKWITVSGKFAGITESLVQDSMHLSLTLPSGRMVNLRFAADRPELRILREGQRITANCQIRHGYGLGVFALENAELVRVEPLRYAERRDFARVS